MIWAKLIAVLHWLRFWFFSLPNPEDLAYVDLHQRCDCCGFRDLTPRCVLKNKPGAQIKNLPPEQKTEIFLQLTCNMCGCRQFKAPITLSARKYLYPAIARNELEKLEDREQRHEAIEAIPNV